MEPLFLSSYYGVLYSDTALYILQLSSVCHFSLMLKSIIWQCVDWENWWQLLSRFIWDCVVLFSLRLHFTRTLRPTGSKSFRSALQPDTLCSALSSASCTHLVPDSQRRNNGGHTCTAVEAWRCHCDLHGCLVPLNEQNGCMATKTRPADCE